eukprot:12691600-Ditylum_brightwellii.AAC.2
MTPYKYEGKHSANDPIIFTNIAKTWQTKHPVCAACALGNGKHLSIQGNHSSQNPSLQGILKLGNTTSGSTISCNHY